MIVRDEAELLPRFLTQAAGLWDELCVVDTGSRDATREILRAAGARVEERPWTDDFSAARNASLAMARGHWIVVLDADEMISPELVRQIRALDLDVGAGAATVRMINEMPHGRTRESHLLRVFHNDPEIRFAHRIHEEVGSSVTRYLRGHRLALRQLDGGVLHLGYGRERAAAKDKKARDRALLHQAVREDARDFYSWMKLLELARFWSDGALEREAGAACLAAIETSGPEHVVGQPFAGDLAALLAGALYPEDPVAGIALMERLAPHTPSAAFSLRLGQFAERAGNLERAADCFAACLDLADVTPDRELATVRPLMGLARVALSRPRGIEEAWAHTERALGFNPRDPEALVAATSICRIAGGAALVGQFVADYRARHGDTEELREALAPGERAA